LRKSGVCSRGITRAKDRLYLIHAFRRATFGRSEPTQESRFLETSSRPAARRAASEHLRALLPSLDLARALVCGFPASGDASQAFATPSFRRRSSDSPEVRRGTVVKPNLGDDEQVGIIRQPGREDAAGALRQLEVR
jgi:hypothetical protein